MAKKEPKQTNPAYTIGESLLNTLSVVGDVNGRKMFGGYGIFAEGAMFVLVSKAGDIHFKVDDTNRQKYEAAGSQQFMNMPYFQLPDAVYQQDDDLFAWAKESIAIAQAAKKKKK
ncbi:MAG: TfoX/Sxy family protein [Chloroflexi bacterium]|nr:TfoX/Sxy family protein [Chloroflexota bacterium]